MSQPKFYGSFTGEEFDAFWGKWNAQKIAVIRKYLNAPRGMWTEREMTLEKQLSSALDRLESPIVQEAV